ncbi:hypothetical protein EDD18DRAFT_1112450 [Armillaria luteobubalina]|uniref:Uncharacterized protein n=1 Tax=Armillaria luteobubalina TaxID=153913 RepID=A0AA39TE39_9AGAR|nr:hypothetical protein EDD18DRAFT_1112450 [Armillaria luteobubalina]
MQGHTKFTLGDITKFSQNYKGVNDGRVGTYIEEDQIFIMTTNSKFIPHPPNSQEIHLYEDGRFGDHDPTRVPQFFEEKFCHFSAIPLQPLVFDLNHPYYQWLNKIWYNVADSDIIFSTGYLSHIGLLHPFIHKCFQHAWDYIKGRCSRIQNTKMFSEEFSEFLSISLDVAEQHMKAGIPVYLFRPIEQFTNQIILKAEQPTVFRVNKTLPQPSFPVMFSGDPSHPKKFDAMHHFMRIFHTYCNPFNFPTVSSPPPPAIPLISASPSPSVPPSTSGAPVHNQRSKTRASGPLDKGSLQRSKTKNLQLMRDKFADLCGRYAPLTIPAWVGVNVKIDKDSEHSQQREAQTRRIQSQHDAAGEKNYNVQMGYAFPDPGLFVYASATQKSIYFHQWEHFQDALIYCVASSTSNAMPVCPQVWRELLAMPFKKEHTKTTKAHDTMLDMMGTALQISGPDVRNPTAHTDQPFDDNWGCYLVWELCKLNFRLELLALDTHLTRSLVSDTADFQLKCQTFRKIMLEWEVLLVFEVKGLLDPSGDETSLGVEKALVKHYVQTFFDSFGQPPVLPCIPHQNAPINQLEGLETEK